MPLCAPLATGNGLFWKNLENYSDSNFSLQQYSGPVWWADNFRIILSVNTTQVASAKQLDQIKEDWSLLQTRIQEQVVKSGLRVFSEKFLLSFCKHLFKDQNKKVTDEKEDKTGEKDAYIRSFFHTLRKGEGIGDVLWTVPYSQEWVQWEDDHGMTPLHVAVDLKQPDLVKTCITKGSDVNHKDGQGWTPLHFAAYRGDLDICEILICNGNAGVMSISKDGTLPLHYLVRYAPTEAELRKYLTVLDMLIKRGAPINAQTKHGETPLHQACLKGSADAAQFLLNNGADCNIRNNNGETALCFAVISGQRIIVTMLVEHGADCTIGGINGTALEMAKRLGHLEIFYFLSGFAGLKNSSGTPTLNLFDNKTSEDLLPRPSLTKSSSDGDITTTTTNSSITSSNSSSSISSTSNIHSGDTNSNKISRKILTGEIYPHAFQLTHFTSLTWCAFCGYFVWGIRRQGYVCSECQYSVHPKCKKLAILSETCKAVQEKSSSFVSPFSSSSISIPASPTNSNQNTPSPSPHKLSSSQPSPTIQFTTSNPASPINGRPQQSSNSAQTTPTTSFELSDASLSINSPNDSVTNSEMSECEDSPEEPVLEEFQHQFTVEFMDLLYSQFNILDRVQRGYLTRTEFGTTLGTVINDSGLLDALFSAFDQNKDDKIDMREYFLGMNILMNGDQDSQIKFAFTMMDRNGDGYLTRDELRGLAESMHRSLGNVQVLIDRNPDYFTDHLFPKGLQAITFPLYKEHVLKHIRFVQSLGLLDEDEKRSMNLLSSCSNSKLTKAKKKGRLITLGNESWHMVQHLMLGIRQVVGEATHSVEKELKAKDFEEQVDFRLVNSANECCWIFKDFAPMVFRKIRELWNIDPKVYMFSLGPEKILGNLLLGNLSALCEVVSTGRSGSLFFKTNDGKFLLKTVPQQEELLARFLLPAYYAHASKYPNMLMTRFLGVHIMAKGPAGRQPDLRFVVMTNIFDTPLKIHEQYDLKGSTVGRHVDAPDTNDGEEDAEVALKDLDFKRRIYLGPENKAILLEQLEQDCKFMEQHNICDYSFLIGVHKIDHKSPLYNSTIPVPPSPKPLSQKNRFLEKTSVFHRDFGGIMSYDRKEVYFIGIIDTLTTWELAKKLERTLKSIFHDSSQISAIAPTPYRARLQKYISSIVD